MKFDRSLEISRDFWKWFRGIESDLSKDFENPELLSALDRWINRIHPDLSWEIGPGFQKENMFVISPNLDKKLFPLSKAIVQMAPEIAGWEFFSAKPAKEWDGLIEIDAGTPRCRRFDLSNWQFVLLQYPDDAIEILLTADRFSAESQETKELLSALALECILGEELLLDVVDGFEFCDEIDVEFAAKARPIRDLREAFTRRGK